MKTVLLELRDRLAVKLWNRFSPDDELDWDDCNDREKWQCMADACLEVMDTLDDEPCDCNPGDPCKAHRPVPSDAVIHSTWQAGANTCSLSPDWIMGAKWARDYESKT